MSIGSRIKSARKAIGLTQDAFAEKTGIPIDTLRKYEGDKSQPGAVAISGIAKSGINTNWLVTGTGEMLVSYQPVSGATVLTAEEPNAQHRVKRPEIDAVLLAGIIAAVDMANQQLGSSERAAIAAKAYAEAISAANPSQGGKNFLP